MSIEDVINFYRRKGVDLTPLGNDEKKVNIGGYENRVT